MDGDDFALFDLPEPRSAELKDRPTGRGRTRETYCRTTAADVHVLRPERLREAALSNFDNGAILIETDIAEDEDPDLPNAREDIAANIASALSWLIEPTRGLEKLLEAGVIRLTTAGVDVDEDAAGLEDGHHLVTWTTVIKLMDAGVFHEHAIASDADTAARAEAGRSVAAAWNLAADPYAPIRDVPAITWAPRLVTIEQVYARPGRQS